MAALAFLAGSVSAAVVNQLILPKLQSSSDTGIIRAQDDDKVDLGSSSYEFRNAYIDGTAYIDTLSVDSVTVTTLGATTVTAGSVTTTGDVDINGTLLEDVTTISSTTYCGTSVSSLTVTQSGYIIFKSTQALTIGLPPVSGNAGLSYTIISSTSTDVGGPVTYTIDGNGAETINGSTTNTEMDAWYDSLKITCDGTEWFITGGNIQ